MAMVDCSGEIVLGEIDSVALEQAIDCGEIRLNRTAVPQLVRLDGMYQRAPGLFSFDLLNPFKTNLSISEIQTSCGCTAGVIASKSLPAGGRVQVVLSIEPHTEDRFSTDFRIYTEFGWHHFTAVGPAKPRVDLISKRWEVGQRRGQVTLSLAVLDPSLRGHVLTLNSLDGGLEETEQGWGLSYFDLDESRSFPVEIWHGKTLVAKHEIELVREDYLKVMPSLVFVPEFGSRRCSIFIPQRETADKIQLEVNGVPLAQGIKATPYGELIKIEFEVDSDLPKGRLPLKVTQGSRSNEITIVQL